MPAHFDNMISSHAAEKLFRIVADVEKYPEFLPWVEGARILERNDAENWFIAELLVKFKSFSQVYSSKVRLIYPDKNSISYKIKTDLVKGPFKYLENSWLFTPAEDQKTEVIFELDFKFNSLLLEKMIGAMFKKATQKMTRSFIKRADDL